MCYLVVGAVPATAAVQKVMSTDAVFTALAVLVAAGLVFAVCQLVRAARRMVTSAHRPWGEPALRAAARVAVGAGALTVGYAVLFGLFAGRGGADVVLRNFHILDALSRLALIAAVALFLAALVFFPPFAAVVLVEGGFVIVMTEAAATPATMAAGAAVLGELSVLLSEAADSTGSSGSGGSGGSSGSGGSGGNLPDLVTKQSQLEAKFKHASDFGVNEPRGATGFANFGQAVKDS